MSTVGSVHMCSWNTELLPAEFSTASLMLQNRSTVVLGEAEETEQMRFLAFSSRLCPQNPLFNNSPVFSALDFLFSAWTLKSEKKIHYNKWNLRTFVINIAGMWMAAQWTLLLTLECSRVMYKGVLLAFATDLYILLMLVLKCVYVEQENHALYHSE